MGIGFGGVGAGLWLIQFGVLAFLDTKLFKVQVVDGKRQLPAFIWGIALLSIGGLFALQGLGSLFTSFGDFMWIGAGPLYVISKLFANMVQIALSVFVILSCVNRVRLRPPKFTLLKIILGAAAAFFGLLYFVGSLTFNPMAAAFGAFGGYGYY